MLPNCTLSLLYICHQIITRLIVIPLLTQVSQQYIQSYTIMQHSAVSQQLVQLQSSQQVYVCKVHIFRVGHNILRNLHLTFSYEVPVKIKVEISQNFVAFLEYMNFSRKKSSSMASPKMQRARPAPIEMLSHTYVPFIHALTEVKICN